MRRVAGTTLIELLVVIVIFMIGILAVVQIFPKGFQILTVTRNNSVAVHLAEDEQERLKQHADQLPQNILAIHYVNGTPVVDSTRNPYDLGPQGDSVDVNGNLSLGGTNVGKWLLYSGPNSFRRVVAEGARVPSPRPVGSNYGGLMLLNFGPIDAGPNPTTAPNLSAYANDFTKDIQLPNNLTQSTSALNVSIGGSPVSCSLYDSTDTLSPTEYFVANSTAASATLLMPTNSSFARTYHLRFAAYLSTGLRKDFPDLAITIPAMTTSDVDASGNYYPLVAVPIGSILSNLQLLQSSENFVSVDYDSVQVAPAYTLIPTTQTFSSDPLQYKLLDANLGVLLFNPAAYSATIEHPGGAREPLQARVDYDVYDWRIIRQEFRLDDQQALDSAESLAYGDYGQFTLALQSIKVGTAQGPDGVANDGIIPLEGSDASPAGDQSPNCDNFVLVDTQTGGVVYEVDPTSKNQIMTVNKSTGVVTLHSDGPGTGLMGYLAIPGTSGATQVNLAGRSLRALYRARQEFSVNVLKSAAYYSMVETPGSGQALAQGTVYSPGNGVLVFPASDIHQQVVIDTINYTDAKGGFNIVHGQSFQIETPVSGGSPQVNLASVLPSGATITNVQGIKGASIVVQVLWNPDQFHLTNSGTQNIGLIDTWQHGWRRNINQSNIPAQELQ